MVKTSDILWDVHPENIWGIHQRPTSGGAPRWEAHDAPDELVDTVGWLFGGGKFMGWFGCVSFGGGKFSLGWIFYTIGVGWFRWVNAFLPPCGLGMNSNLGFVCLVGDFVDMHWIPWDSSPFKQKHRLGEDGMFGTFSKHRRVAKISSATYKSPFFRGTWIIPVSKWLWTMVIISPPRIKSWSNIWECDTAWEETAGKPSFRWVFPQSWLVVVV